MGKVIGKTTTKRPLLNTANVADFMRDVLGLNPRANDEDAKNCIRIRDAEQLLSIYDSSNTKDSLSFRDPRYHSDEERVELRSQINRELWSKLRYRNDDKVCLGRGGLKPKNGYTRKRKAYIVTGLPASGKSGAASQIADGAGAIIIDSDFAKRKFPEFNKDYGASLVHSESRMITEGLVSDPNYQGVSLLGTAVEFGVNVVMPKIGADLGGVKTYINYFLNEKYSCYLIHVELDRVAATRRAYDRFVKTDRYVPLALILDGYANDPTLVFQKLKNLEDLSGYIYLQPSRRKGTFSIVEEERCGSLKKWISLR